MPGRKESDFTRQRFRPPELTHGTGPLNILPRGKYPSTDNIWELQLGWYYTMSKLLLHLALICFTDIIRLSSKVPWGLIYQWNGYDYPPDTVITLDIMEGPCSLSSKRRQCHWNLKQSSPPEVAMIHAFSTLQAPCPKFLLEDWCKSPISSGWDFTEEKSYALMIVKWHHDSTKLRHGTCFQDHNTSFRAATMNAKTAYANM